MGPGFHGIDLRFAEHLFGWLGLSAIARRHPLQGDAGGLDRSSGQLGQALCLPVAGPGIGS